MIKDQFLKFTKVREFYRGLKLTFPKTRDRPSYKYDFSKIVSTPQKSSLTSIPLQFKRRNFTTKGIEKSI
ncbi:MAG: hypothetical protein ACD_57C00053G0003 [uncultured bacterium]|nr:MAG: hypothetical protein ACD_57C00053G0003 [uncultured bacterium]OGD81274.1 MAG: hypothetical protein A2683_02995 [Candidatus Curtissbacteria bacterium RIFCSPHIGHO2_01_FULL_34_40]OGD91637.1 MAG: hypothetical protein A3E14_03045 [Candidatus Curtissbacteria bacterium RIFCSPHIGHO2_12_FULL_41_13]OGD96251.1 MAG: hypothetical protein A3B52_00900 [Candidatus Curtissbacteria bacterium RIFCSPLOWO2_01_FULL_41_28]OGE05795.1 MAG: hypothetical protein A2362_03040 [Candidatus Curtissbacteria bacterium RI